MLRGENFIGHHAEGKQIRFHSCWTSQEKLGRHIPQGSRQLRFCILISG